MQRVVRSVSSWSALSLCLLLTSSARAQSAGTMPEAPAPEEAPVVAAASDAAPPSAPSQIPVTTTRRYGFVAGIVGGGQITGVSGSPVKFTKRDQRVSTGAAAGTGMTLFIGGVFTDWFSFHLGFASDSASKGDYQIAGGTVIFGVETWPLFKLGGVFRDIGVGADFGTGTATLKTKSSDTAIADGSGGSSIRGTVFWDAVSLWKINLGPYVAYERRDGETYSQNTGWLGLRTVFYGVNERLSRSARRAAARSRRATARSR